MDLFAQVFVFGQFGMVWDWINLKARWRITERLDRGWMLSNYRDRPKNHILRKSRYYPQLPESYPSAGLAAELASWTVLSSLRPLTSGITPKVLRRRSILSTSTFSPLSPSSPFSPLKPGNPCKSTTPLYYSSLQRFCTGAGFACTELKRAREDWGRNMSEGKVKKDRVKRAELLIGKSSFSQKWKEKNASL